MSKNIYNPLNLDNLVPVDYDDMSQCEPDVILLPWGFQKGVPHTKSHCKRISKALKGKKAGAGQIAATKAATIVNTGKKRPEHSKLLKEMYKNGELFMPRGQAKGKRTGQALENIRNGVRMRKKQVSCIKCHKPTDGSMFEGQWMAHFANHHKSC